VNGTLPTRATLGAEDLISLGDRVRCSGIHDVDGVVEQLHDVGAGLIGFGFDGGFDERPARPARVG
jgi:hypothetical protein